MGALRWKQKYCCFWATWCINNCRTADTKAVEPMRMYVKMRLLKRLQHPCLFLYQDFLIRLHASTSHKYTWAYCFIKMLVCPMLLRLWVIIYTTALATWFPSRIMRIACTRLYQWNCSLAWWKHCWSYHLGSHPRITWRTFGQSKSAIMVHNCARRVMFLCKVQR